MSVTKSQLPPKTIIPITPSSHTRTTRQSAQSSFYSMLQPSCQASSCRHTQLQIQAALLHITQMQYPAGLRRLQVRPVFLSYLVCPYLLINPSTRLPTNNKNTANELYRSLPCINARIVTTTTPAKIPRNTLSLFAIRILQPAAISRIPDRIREKPVLTKCKHCQQHWNRDGQITCIHIDISEC